MIDLAPDLAAFDALLNNSAEEAFDRITRLTARMLHTRIALILLNGAGGPFLKSSFGLPEPWASQREVPLAPNFLRDAIERQAPTSVRDAREESSARRVFLADGPAA